MQRQKPDPLPRVHPVPEYLADDDLRARYENMKQVFQVPWMGVVTMAFAHYREFFDALWSGTRELCGSEPWITACAELRTFAESQVGGLAPAPIVARLQEAGFAPGEVTAIGETVEVFSHGNFPYLMMATLSRLILEGGDAGEGAATPFNGRHAPDVAVPFVLMEYHHATVETQAVYDDVMATLGLPFVNTDYRAFARWPTYVAMAWKDIRPVVLSADYEPVVRLVHDRAVDLARSLPNPGGLDAEALRQAASNAGGNDEVLNVVRLFQWLLPGLVTNVAWFRAQLSS
jgi:hypothetical protein